MTDSEKAIDELRSALGNIDIKRAARSLTVLQETRTINREQARQIHCGLGALRDVLNAFPNTRVIRPAN
jgi:hypothetical protein